MQLFDCNCCYGRTTQPAFRFAATPAELIAEMDWYGIERALVYHANQRFSSPTTYNPIITDELSGQPRLEATWAILPSQTGELPLPAELFISMKAAGIRALRAFPDEQRYNLDSLTFGELCAALVERRVPLFVRWNCLAIGVLLKDCPNLTVVAVNQGPHSFERYLRPLLDRFPNFHLETSGLLVEGLLEEFCARYGSQRLLFGSGYPDNCGGGALLCLTQARISDADKAAIAGGNLDRLLNKVELPC